jgi:hypothetical protein
MIAFATLAGTMVATKTGPFHTAAAEPSEDTFPTAFLDIAQARMSTAKAPQSTASLPMAGSSARSSTTPLGPVAAENPAIATSLESKGLPIAPSATHEEPLLADRTHPAGDVAQPSQNPTLRDQETNAQAASSATGTLSATVPAPQATAGALATEEGPTAAMLPAADAEAIKRTTTKAQVPAPGASHPADLHKVLVGGAPHAAHLSPANDVAPSSTILSGEHRETGPPTQSVPPTSGEQGPILPPSISASAASTKPPRQHEHSAPARAVSAHASPAAGSNPEDSVAATVDAPDAVPAGGSVAKVQPDESPSFKAELSMASQESGHILSPSTGMPLNPPSDPHSAGRGPNPSGLAETAGEDTASGAAGYFASMSHESPSTLVATPTTLEVGVPRGAEGWLKIRAEVGSDGISASLSTVSHAGQSMLRDQLPAINAFLQGEHIHASATVLDKGIPTSSGDGSSSAGMDRGLGQEGRAQGEQRQLSQNHEKAPGLAENSHTVSPQAGVGVLLPAVSERVGASLSVLA